MAAAAAAEAKVEYTAMLLGATGNADGQILHLLVQSRTTWRAPWSRSRSRRSSHSRRTKARGSRGEDSRVQGDEVVIRGDP
jgi:hypothetical protein